MDKSQIAEIKEKFNEILAGEPFNGVMTHRNRKEFLIRFKKVLSIYGIRDGSYLNDLLKAMGK